MTEIDPEVALRTFRELVQRHFEFLRTEYGFVEYDPRLAAAESGTVALWPPSFFGEFYRDDLSEGVPEITDDYERVKRQIEAEATESMLQRV